MSIATVRGGVPYVIRDTIDTVGRALALPCDSLALIARNKGAAVIRLYFTAADWAADVRYVELPVASALQPYGEWAGPVETVAGSDHSDLWVKAITSSSALELTVFQRRG